GWSVGGGAAAHAGGFGLRPCGRVRAVVRALPGVESVSAARNLPLMLLTWRASMHVDGESGPPRRIDVMPVGPRYFETLRIPLLRGRDFADQDARFLCPGATPAAVHPPLPHRLF